MPFKSETYRILIASPSDLTKERQIATEAIHEWNTQHSDAESVVLLPIKWETHALPESGLPPQEAINRQLVKKCDILIGMFWTKLGTKTGAADSGTVEEIDQFVAAGKPALLYFSNRPIDPNKIDYAQHKKLKKFKDATYRKALIGTFNQTTKLRQTLERDLLRQVRELKERRSTSDTKKEIEIQQLRKEVELLTDRLRVEQTRSAQAEVFKKQFEDLSLRLDETIERLAQSKSMREAEKRSWEDKLADLNSKLAVTESKLNEARKPQQRELEHDWSLTQTVVEQLNYGRTFTNSFNLVQLLAKIGQSCSLTDEGRRLFSGMTDRNHFTGSKIDYGKVALFLLRGWDHLKGKPG